MHPRRFFFVLGTPVLAKGNQLGSGHWTVSVWINPSVTGLAERKADLVFPTLMRDAGEALALIEISVRDHLQSGRSGGKAWPTGLYETGEDCRAGLPLKTRMPAEHRSRQAM